MLHKMYTHLYFQGRKGNSMLRLTVGVDDYIQINDNIKIMFLGGSPKNTRIMIDAPKEVKIVREKAIKSDKKRE